MSKKKKFVDDETTVFTEADIYIVAGYLAEQWCPELRTKVVCKDAAKAIRTVLEYHIRQDS